MIPNDIERELRPIADEAHRIHESAMYSSQAQFESGKMWNVVNILLGVPAAGLAAISGGTGLANKDGSAVPATLALIAAAFGAALTTLNPSRRTTHAQASANAYLELQTRARQFITIDLAGSSLEDARTYLSQLTTSRDELNKTSDPPGLYARWRSKRNIEKGGQSYAVDSTEEGS